MNEIKNRKLNEYSKNHPSSNIGKRTKMIMMYLLMVSWKEGAGSSCNIVLLAIAFNLFLRIV